MTTAAELMARYPRFAGGGHTLHGDDGSAPQVSIAGQAAPGSGTGALDPTQYAATATQDAAANQTIASALGIPENQLTLQDIQNYNLQQNARTSDAGGGLMGTLIDRVAPAIMVGALTAGAGSALGAGVGAETGAAEGAINAAGTDTLTGQPLTLGSVGKGALMGGITGGLQNVAAPATSDLSSGIQNSTGLGSTTSDALAGGLTRGVIGAGVGALGSSLSGGNAATGAEVGGASGAASGAVQGATGSQGLGTLAGAGAGIIAGNLTKPSTPTSTLPSLPASAAPAATTMPSLPASTNIGSYSGFNLAPRTQVSPGITDYDTYGQGPEAQFFNGEQGYSGSPSTAGGGTGLVGQDSGTANTQPVTTNPLLRT